MNLDDEVDVMVMYFFPNSHENKAQMLALMSNLTLEHVDSLKNETMVCFAFLYMHLHVTKYEQYAAILQKRSVLHWRCVNRVYSTLSEDVKRSFLCYNAYMSLVINTKRLLKNSESYTFANAVHHFIGLAKKLHEHSEFHVVWDTSLTKESIRAYIHEKVMPVFRSVCGLGSRDALILEIAEYGLDKSLTMRALVGLDKMLSKCLTIKMKTASSRLAKLKASKREKTSYKTELLMNSLIDGALEIRTR
jgi:hypothetical protein